MRKFKVVVQELAKTDMRQARQWYNRQQAGLGKRLHQDMTGIIIKIANNPTSFSVRYKLIRLAHFDTFPYAAHFYIDDTNDTVCIIAILHNRRQPDSQNDRF